MRKVFAAIFCGLSFGGCGKQPADKPPAPAASTTQPAATLPTSQPAQTMSVAATQSGPVQLTVGGEPIDFATAKLAVHADGGDVQFTLMGEDHAVGSSTTFRLGGTVHDVTPDELAGESVHRVIDPADPNTPDSPDGLLMANEAIQFEPRDVTVRFGGTYPQLTVHISGTFQRVDSDAQPVSVQGEWIVVAEDR